MTLHEPCKNVCFSVGDIDRVKDVASQLVLELGLLPQEWKETLMSVALLKRGEDPGWSYKFVTGEDRSITGWMIARAASMRSEILRNNPHAIVPDKFNFVDKIFGKLRPDQIRSAYECHLEEARIEQNAG